MNNNWEKEFDEFFYVDYFGLSAVPNPTPESDKIKNWIKQFVPKTVAGMRWVKASVDNVSNISHTGIIREIANKTKAFTGSNIDACYSDTVRFKRAGNYFTARYDELEILDESPSLSSLIEQVRAENPFENSFHKMGQYKSEGWNAALDKLIDKLK